MRIILKENLLNFYDKNKRPLPWRVDPSPYKIWVSEIMLQQTRARAVIPYYENFLSAIPDIDSLACADENLLHKLWQGLGYYSRVSNMKKAAQEIREKYQGEMPSTYDKLLSLKGIGPYTAGAISSIAFNQVVPAIDGNLLRVYSRLYSIEDAIDTSKGKRKIYDLVMKDISQDMPGDFNQALMDLSNAFCLPKNPNCPLCPIREYCQAYREGSQKDYPKKKAKPSKKIEEWTFLLLERNGQFLIHQRPKKGLLANLWQFPQLPRFLTKEDVEKILLEKGLIPTTIQKLSPSRHVFSHKIWNIEAYLIHLNPYIVGEEDLFYGPYKWACGQEIEDIYPYASAIAPYVKEVLQWNG